MLDSPAGSGMFPFVSSLQRGASRSSRRAGWNAVDATASGASGVAGRLSGRERASFRVNDPALTASSHGFDGEHTPVVEVPAKMCADGEVVWSRRPKLAPSLAEV